MPEEAWDALEVSRLRRAIEDESYRDEVLREKGIVRPGHPSCHPHIACSTAYFSVLLIFCLPVPAVTATSLDNDLSAEPLLYCQMYELRQTLI